MPPSMSDAADYCLFVSADRLTFVRLWDNGVCEVARRDAPGDVWGPPVVCEAETIVAAPVRAESGIRYWGD